MPAPLRIKLNLQEEETLAELRKAISVPYRTRERAHMLKLNAQGKAEMSGTKSETRWSLESVFWVYGKKEQVREYGLA